MTETTLQTPGVASTPRRHAILTQTDIARAIRAAKQAGAVELEIRVGEASIVVRLAPSTGSKSALETQGEIRL